MPIKRVCISWVRANKPELSDASLRQKLVRLLGDVYTQAVSNTLTLTGGQTNRFFANKRKKKEIEVSHLHALLGQLIVTLACWGFYSHAQTVAKHSSPHVKLTRERLIQITAVYRKLVKANLQNVNHKSLHGNTPCNHWCGRRYKCCRPSAKDDWSEVTLYYTINHFMGTHLKGKCWKDWKNSSRAWQLAAII